MESSTKPNIRTATLADAPAIVELIRILAEAENEGSPLSEPYVLQYLTSFNSEVLLAEVQGRVVGLLSYSLRPDLYHAAPCCLIEALVVRSENRDQGVGSQLLDTIFASATNNGWAEIGVGVMPDNIEAQQLYRRYGLTDEALLLERHLPPTKIEC